MNGGINIAQRCVAVFKNPYITPADGLIKAGIQEQFECSVDRVKPRNVSISWHFADTPYEEFQGLTQSTQLLGLYCCIFILSYKYILH